MLCQGFDTRLWEMFWGHALMVGCCLFYLLWWCLTFKPGASPSTLGRASIALAFLTGIAGLVLIIMGMGARESATRGLPEWIIVAGGVACYIILLLITSKVLERQVTSELLLIVGWAILEFSVIDVLYGVGRLGGAGTVVLAIVICAVVVASLICYVAYYRLGGTAGWIDGMIPLITGAVFMAVMMVVMAFSKTGPLIG